MKKVHDVQQRSHYYLVHGAIVFAHVDQEQVGSIDMNGLLITENKNIALHELNNSQRLLQHNFFKRMPAEKVEIQDVVIKNLTWLGHYTEDEFKNIPEGVAMQVREAAEQAATPASETIIDAIPVANDDDAAIGPVGVDVALADQAQAEHEYSNEQPIEVPIETTEAGEPQPVITEPNENPDRIEDVAVTSAN